MKMKNIRGKKLRSFILVFIFCFLFLTGDALANNLAVTNVGLSNTNLGLRTTDVGFDISWDNSWRDATNYDAVWVFIKYSTDAGSTWAHATLKTAGANPAGFSQGAGTGLDIIVPADKKGVFLQRSANGAGNVATTGIQLVWDWAADGVSAAIARVKVFAIEMVYIPAGAFYIGDGSAGMVGVFYTYPTTTNPYLISSEGAITVGTNAGNLYAQGASPGVVVGTLPAAFPKGYAAFYAMKYEITQGQYADFLNCLTYDQASQRYPNYNGSARYAIGGAHPNYSSTKANSACGYLTGADLAAYLDWAALRPGTEFEYEKVSRGTANPVGWELPWGNSNMTQATTLSGAEDGTETVTNSAKANLNCGNTMGGPLRSGIFADATSTRQKSGSGYYGVMELAGNVSDMSIVVSNASGLAFDGLHGDGELSSSGAADVSNWSAMSEGSGNGVWGGDWSNGCVRCYTSDRKARRGSLGTTRWSNVGGRGVRTAP